MRLFQTLVFFGLAVAIPTSKAEHFELKSGNNPLNLHMSENVEMFGEATTRNATNEGNNYGKFHEDTEPSILLEKANKYTGIEDSNPAAIHKSGPQRKKTPAPRAVPSQIPNSKSAARTTFEAIFANLTRILRLIDNASPVRGDTSQAFYASIISLQKSYMRKYIGADSTEWSSYPEFGAFQQKTRRLSQIVRSMRIAVQRKQLLENKRPMDPEFESFRLRLAKLENDMLVVEELTMWEDVVEETRLKYLRGIVADVKRNFESFQRFDIPFWIDEPGFDAVNQRLVLIAKKIENLESFLRVSREWDNKGDGELHFRFEKYKSEVIRVDDLARYYVNHFHETPNANDEMKRIMAKVLVRIVTWFARIEETNTSVWISEPEFYIVHSLKERIAGSIDTLESILSDQPFHL